MAAQKTIVFLAAHRFADTEFLGRTHACGGRVSSTHRQGFLAATGGEGEWLSPSNRTEVGMFKPEALT